MNLYEYSHLLISQKKEIVLPLQETISSLRTQLCLGKINNAPKSLILVVNLVGCLNQSNELLWWTIDHFLIPPFDQQKFSTNIFFCICVDMLIYLKLIYFLPKSFRNLFLSKRNILIAEQENLKIYITTDRERQELKKIESFVYLRT